MTDGVLAAPVASPPALVTLRRELHRWPVLRFAEHRTAGLVASRLRALGYAVRTGVGGTGVFGWRAGDRPGPHLLIRADMDALPITDLKEVAYASAVPGVAHACGHDVHTGVALGVAELLVAEPPARGRVSFVFQPAEERPFGEPSGARAMLNDGVLDDAAPDAVLSLHCWPDLPAGTIGIDDRIAMGAKDAFRIVLHGRSAHAASPSRGRDAILGMAQLVTALHAGYARSLDAGDLAALNVGTLRGGSSQSVVADHAEATGTLRTVDPGVRARLRAEIERIASGTAGAMGLEPTLTWADEMPPIVNDPGLARLALTVAGRLLGEAQVRHLSVPPMTADDFALFAELAPALYLKLGVRGGDPWPPLHNGSFDVDERCIGVGIAVLHGIVLELLATGPETWGTP